LFARDRAEGFTRAEVVGIGPQAKKFLGVCGHRLVEYLGEQFYVSVQGDSVHLPMVREGVVGRKTDGHGRDPVYYGRTDRPEDIIGFGNR